MFVFVIKNKVTVGGYTTGPACQLVETMACYYEFDKFQRNLLFISARNALKISFKEVLTFTSLPVFL